MFLGNLNCRALNSHALCVRHTHFNQNLRSHASKHLISRFDHGLLIALVCSLLASYNRQTVCESHAIRPLASITRSCMPLALHAYASPRALRVRIMHATVPYPYRIRVYVRTCARDLYALISIKYVRVVHTRARAEWFAHTVAISQLLLFLKKRQVIFFSRDQ